MKRETAGLEHGFTIGANQGAREAQTELIRTYQPEVLRPMLLQEPFSNLLSPNQAFEIELLSFKVTSNSTNIQEYIRNK